MTDKITAFMAVNTFARFEAPRPDNWDDLSAEDKAEYMYTHGERKAILCHHCAKDIECDFELTENAVSILEREYMRATTFRKQLVKHIHEQMVYKESHYSSDENAFTKAIKGVVGDKVASFRSEFNTTVDSLFTKQCLEHAQKYLQKKLGIQ